MPQRQRGKYHVSPGPVWRNLTRRRKQGDVKTCGVLAWSPLTLTARTDTCRGSLLTTLQGFPHSNRGFETHTSQRGIPQQSPHSTSWARAPSFHRGSHCPASSFSKPPPITTAGTQPSRPTHSTSTPYLAQGVQPGASSYQDPGQGIPDKSRRTKRDTVKRQNFLNRTFFYCEEETGDLVHSSRKKDSSLGLVWDPAHYHHLLQFGV